MSDETQAAAAVAQGAVRCAACGTENPSGMRFCGNCGQPLVAAATPGPSPADGEGESKTTTLVSSAGLGVAKVSSETSVTLPVSPSPSAGEGPGVVAETLPAKVAIPTDPIARERERDRLLTLVNVQRMRGQTGDARKTLENALLLVEGAGAAPIYELIGDLLVDDEKWTDALEAYDKAHQADPKRASAERKYATMTLRVADSRAQRNLADAVLRGDSISDLVATGALESGRGKRNAGMAMFLSCITPGFGQFYNGEVIKGVVLVGIFLADLLLLALTPDRDIFTRKFAAIFALSSGKYANQQVSGLSIFAGIVLVAVWLYAIVDAPFMAAKTTQRDGEGGNKPPIDKTGWEV